MLKVKGFGLFLAVILCGFWIQTASGAFEWDVCGPRSAALGGAGVAIAGDGWMVFRNPALLPGNGAVAGFSWSQQFELPELSREDLGVTFPVHGHAFGITAETFGSPLYRETETGLVWAKGIQPKLKIGVHAQLMRLEIEGYSSSQAATFSVGVAGNPLDDFTVAAVWRNLSEPKLSGYQDRIRESLTVGFSARVIAGGFIVADLIQEKGFQTELRVGAEARVLPHLVLRAGGRAEPVRPSAGMQIDLKRWGFVYAGDLHPDLGASHYVGVEFRIGK